MQNNIIDHKVKGQCANVLKSPHLKIHSLYGLDFDNDEDQHKKHLGQNVNMSPSMTKVKVMVQMNLKYHNLPEYCS